MASKMVDLDAIEDAGIKILGDEFRFGDLTVAKQDAMLEMAMLDDSGLDPTVERAEGESDDAFNARKRAAVDGAKAASRRVTYALCENIAALVDDPGDLAERLKRAADAGEVGMVRLRKAQEAAAAHFGGEQGNA